LFPAVKCPALLIGTSVESKRERKNEEAQMSIDTREGKLHADSQSRSPKPSTSAEPSSSAWGLARPMGAGEANGGRKPPASSPSSPVPKTKEAAGPNS